MNVMAIENVHTTTDCITMAEQLMKAADAITTREQHASIWDKKVTLLNKVNSSLSTGGFDGSGYHELHKAKHLIHIIEHKAGQASLRTYMKGESQ